MTSTESILRAKRGAKVFLETLDFFSFSEPKVQISFHYSAISNDLHRRHKLFTSSPASETPSRFQPNFVHKSQEEE